MNNAFNLKQLLMWLGSYIFYGKLIPTVFMLLTIMYVFGYHQNKAIKQAEKDGKFEIKKHKYNPSLAIFNRVNRGLDFLIKMVATYAWKPAYSYVEAYIPDSMIEKVLQKLGFNSSFEHRVLVAKEEFEPIGNAFWWAKLRAPDYRNINPVISGKWFNGQSVEKYLPFLISPKTIYKSFRVGVIVFFCSFLALSLVNKPQLYFGWLANSTKNRISKDMAEKIVANPAIAPQYRRDYWSQEEQAEVNSAAQQTALSYAEKLVDNAQGYNYYWFGFLFKNGLMTDLFFSIAIGIFFIRRSYYNSYKALKIPFIADSHETAMYESVRESIETKKLNLAASNKRATGFDRNSPLTSIYISAGTFEKKGQILAVRKFQAIYQSFLDLSQNTSLQGGSGSGKSRTGVIPFVENIFDVTNHFYKFKKAYNEVYDTRINRLTPYAIKEGRLDKYCPLPKLPIVVAMTIMDIKSQLWKDLKPVADRKFLGDDFVIVGANEEEGQFSIDILNGLESAKVRSLFESIGSQMSGESKQDFWGESALQWIQRFYDVAILFSRTRAGRKYMKKNMMKVCSLLFIYQLVVQDSGNELLSHAVYNIYLDAEKCPERLRDVLTTEKVQSIGLLLTKWQDLAEETKSGIQANMTRVMAGYNNSKLSPFVSGLGNNVIEISELWNYISAFDLDTNEYNTSGKMILLIIKTLMFEESVNRQIRFSRRLIEISEIYKEAYPQLMTTETSMEIVPIDWLQSKKSIDLLGDYHEYCTYIMEQLGEQWEAGKYLERLNWVKSQLPEQPSLADYKEPMSAELVGMANKALDAAKQIRSLEPRFAKRTNELKLAIPDGSMFNAVEGDSPEVQAQKREHMALFYEFKDASTRISREHMFFIGDEYQELITIDKSGGCYSDYNFPNISRSTNWKFFVATQTLNAYILKIGTEAAANFMNQMRSQVFLASEDNATREYIAKISGTINEFQSDGVINQELKDNGVGTGYTIYKTFNSYISDCVQINIQRAKDGVKLLEAYPYTVDIFAQAEPIETEGAFQFDGLFSNIYNREGKLELPSLKRHFLDESGIKNYKETGSDAQGVQSNADQIQDGWKQARNEMENKYQSFLKEGYKKDVQLHTDKDYTEQGNISAFVILQRAGMLIKDHVLIAPEGDYIETEIDVFHGEKEEEI
ncbi:hypothetical protein [Burkholderia contaminans]|uniref:hypothetical protein n=1 Tax=Burkholderia contaminans TaxID=488447 RepID=UPI00158D9417|nr:hypothetical protein [Burkholderia contaminans]